MRGDSRRGSAMVEFALTFIVFLAMIFAMFDLAYVVFVRGTLHHAVREGVRYAITGRTIAGLGQDDSIKQVIRNNSMGLLSAAQLESLVHIDYYLPACSSGCETAVNGAGNIVVVAVDNYEVEPIGPLLRPAAPFVVSVAAVDKVEPLPGAPPPRTLTP